MRTGIRALLTLVGLELGLNGQLVAQRIDAETQRAEDHQVENMVVE